MQHLFNYYIEETMMDQIFKVTTSLLVVETHIQPKKLTQQYRNKCYERYLLAIARTLVSNALLVMGVS